MKPDFIRQMLRPLFGSDHRELIAGILRAIFTGVIVVSVLVFFSHQWQRGGVFDATTTFLVGLVAIQFFLLFLLKRGFVNQSAVILVVTVWIGVTYLAWHADGVHDVAIYVYMLLILMAALLIGWRFSLTFSALSIIMIWVFAASESRGSRDRKSVV